MPRWIAPFLLLSLYTGIPHAEVKPVQARQNILEVLDDRHTITPGDTVSIRVLEDRRDAEESKVPENGMIEIRYLGAVKVDGMSSQKLAQFIRQKLVAVPLATRPFYSEGPTVVVALANGTHCGPPSMDELDNNTKLQPSWIIGIRIVEDKREKLQQFIADTGEVQTPYIGLVKAAGLTCAELAAKIEGELEKSFFRHATVVVTLDYKGIEEMPNGGTIICFSNAKPVVSARGNVAKPGKYNFPEEKDLIVSEFLACVGGHTSKKAVPTIKILRKTPLGTKMILVNSRAVLLDKSKEHDLFLRHDDEVFVE